MKKLIKLIIFWLFPVSFILVITFALNIFILDFRYGHQSHMIYQPPFSWSKYYINLYFKKFIVNTFVSKKNRITPSSHLFERTISTKAFEQYTLLYKTMGKRIYVK